MTNYDKAKKLQSFIRNLYDELAPLDPKDPKLSATEYLEVKKKREHIQNLIAIAKNELLAVSHQYKLKLVGVAQDKGEIVRRIVKDKIVTEIDCQVKPMSKINLNAGSHKPLLDLINRNYSSLFHEGRYEIKSITQVC